MKKCFWLLFGFVCLFMVAIPAMAADGNGVVGERIVDMLTKLFRDNTTAMAVYTVIAGVLGIVFRVMLKKIPVAMQNILSTIFWKLMVILFGDGVVLENNKDSEFVKSQLIKKYPLLSIDVKPQHFSTIERK